MGIVYEVLADVVFLLVLLGFSSLLLVVVTNLFLSPFGFHAAFSQGFSMCRAETAGLDYLALGNAYCAFVPGDVLVTFRKWPPDVNTIACADTQFGVVCHRVSKVVDGKVCLVGDNPRAVPEFCVGSDEYVGQVVFKLPRAFGMPGLAITATVNLVSDFLDQVNRGLYPSLH